MLQCSRHKILACEIGSLWLSYLRTKNWTKNTVKAIQSVYKGGKKECEETPERANELGKGIPS